MQWESVESCTICLKTNKQKLYGAKLDKIAFNDDITETKVIAGSALHYCPSFDKMFIFFFPLYIWCIMEACMLLLNKKTVSVSRSQDKILMKSIKIRIFYIFLSKTSNITSIDIDLPPWQEGHCRALYYLMLDTFTESGAKNLLTKCGAGRQASCCSRSRF